MTITRLRVLTTALLFALLFIVLMVLQTNRVLEIVGIAPNILLAVLLALTFSLRRNEALIIVLSAVSLLVFVALWWSPFWAWEFFALGIVIIGIVMVRPFLSGNTFVDFAMYAIVATFVFYGLLHPMKRTNVPWLVIAGEALYTVCIGEIFLLLFKRTNRI